jgi:uncharacterized membrane-anchored protein YitT (DUF2179 family)
MKTRKMNSRATLRTLQEYALLTLAMILGAVSLCFFLLPHQITMGGMVGIASIVYWGLGLPVQYVYFALNMILLLIALKVMGWRFCVKTIYAVVVFTVATGVLQPIAQEANLLADQKFMACLVGGVFMGACVGLGLSTGGSTGGSDVIAAMVHKYRDVSLGHILLICDLTIITSSYVVLKDWEKVLYGYVLLFVVSFCVDYLVNSLRQSVQFFIISDKYEEIGHAINQIVVRGCSTLNGNGFYSKKDIHVLYCIAKRSESNLIFNIIEGVDPNAFVAQSACIGVYGTGFDRIKAHNKVKELDEEAHNEILAERLKKEQ